MPCPYCPYLIKVMIDDDELNTSKLYFDMILEEIPRFILRRKEQIKLFIEAFEKKDPSLLKE